MKSERKPEKSAKTKTPSGPAAKIDEKQTGILAASLVAVSKLLVVCAPKFPEGSEGAATVELARKSIPLALNIIRNDKKEGAPQP